MLGHSSIFILIQIHDILSLRNNVNTTTTVTCSFDRRAHESAKIYNIQYSCGNSHYNDVEFSEWCNGFCLHEMSSRKNIFQFRKTLSTVCGVCATSLIQLACIKTGLRHDFKANRKHTVCVNMCTSNKYFLLNTSYVHCKTTNLWDVEILRKSLTF